MLLFITHQPHVGIYASLTYAAYRDESLGTMGARLSRSRRRITRPMVTATISSTLKKIVLKTGKGSERLLVALRSVMFGNIEKIWKRHP